MTREEALQEANQIVAECITVKDRLVQEVIADHLMRLAGIVAELEPRAAFGDQCYQDRCENAYVEQSVLKRLEDVVEEVINDVPDCGPKTKYKLFKAIEISKVSR